MTCWPTRCAWFAPPGATRMCSSEPARAPRWPSPVRRAPWPCSGDAPILCPTTSKPWHSLCWDIASCTRHPPACAAARQTISWRRYWRRRRRPWRPRHEVRRLGRPARTPVLVAALLGRRAAAGHCDPVAAEYLLLSDLPAGRCRRRLVVLESPRSGCSGLPARSVAAPGHVGRHRDPDRGGGEQEVAAAALVARGRRGTVGGRAGCRQRDLLQAASQPVAHLSVRVVVPARRQQPQLCLPGSGRICIWPERAAYRRPFRA